MVAGRIGGVERPTDSLETRSAVLARMVRESDWAGEHASLAEVAEGMTDAALIACLEELGALANLVDAVGARLAGEFAARSERGAAEPLAKRLGNRSAPVGVAAIATCPWVRPPSGVGSASGSELAAP